MIEPSLEEENSQEEKTQEEMPQPEKTALTIHIHSWATPVVGLLMLIIGLVGGFFIRPAVTPLLSQATLTPTASAAAVAGETDPSQPGLKDYVVAQTQHFLGDQDAPVTVIEFSDFQ